MTFMKAINRDILKLAVPSILANITVPIVGMVDIAVAGHLDGAVATMIGGIAIGTMLFDLLYWNFGFLRVGTGGLTAQAFGKEDRKECAYYHHFCSYHLLLEGQPYQHYRYPRSR